MKITAIRRQQRRADRYSIYINNKYECSLSESALLESGLTGGQELDRQGLNKLRRLAAGDKLLDRALHFVALRQRSVWELQAYLKKHGSPALQIEQITNKLLQLGLLDDAKFADAWVRNRQLLRPASRRRLVQELKLKRVSEEDIEAALQANEVSESTSLAEMIAKKRRQPKYAQDPLKLMQYLARQGFNYGDIKDALNQTDPD